MKTVWLGWLGLVLLLAGCGSPQVATLGPTPEAIRVVYPPSLQPWADMLASCATGFPQAAIYLLPTTTPTSNLLAGDIELELGQPTQLDSAAHLFQVGWDQVVVIVNPANKLSSLPSDQLLNIFSGQVSQWENGTGKPIQVWVLPEGDPIRQIFDHNISLSVLASGAKLAPDLQAMRQAISFDVNAIGYLPQSYIVTGNADTVQNVKTIQLDHPTEDKLKAPVLAITTSEPTGIARQILVCLENSGAN